MTAANGNTDSNLLLQRHASSQMSEEEMDTSLGGGSGLTFAWKEIDYTEVHTPKRIEGPCGATATESTVYFRKYWGKDIYSYSHITGKWNNECSCEIDDTTLVMLPIEFNGEEALHTIGGRSEADGSLVKDLYYYKDGDWRKSNYRPMQYERKQVGAVCYQGKYLIVVGGYTKHAPTKVVEILDLEQNKWSIGPDISFKECELQQVHSMNEVALLSHLAMYDTGPIANLLDQLECTKGLNIDDVVEKLIAGLELFKPKLIDELEKELREKRDLLEKALLKELGLYRMSVCICDDDLYILGGFTNIFGQSPLRTGFKANIQSILVAAVEDYTKKPNRKVFSTIHHVPYVRSAFVTYCNTILSIGGCKPLRNNKCVGELYEYQPDIDRWISLPESSSLRIPRSHCVAAAFYSPEEKLMVFGGHLQSHDNHSTDAVEFAVYKPESEIDSTTQCGNAPLPTNTQPASPIHDTSLTLRNVLDATHDARPRWENLLLVLGVNPNTIEAIAKRYDDAGDCLREGLSEWLKGGKKSWRDVVDALSNKTVGYIDVAKQVEKEYLHPRQ